jgi:delta-aminolevulinic acid dehydratase/porphobilinogen synthase/uroporphyrinogen-III synthase
LVQRLEALGGAVVEFPTIEIRSPGSYVSLDRAIRQIATYDWLIFTSVNGVEQFLNRFEQLGKKVSDIAGIEIGAIGPETANRLAAARIQPSLVPKQYRAEGILEMLTPETLRGKRVYTRQPKRAILPETLRHAPRLISWSIPNRVASGRVLALCSLLREDGLAITFTSSSTVSNFAALRDQDLPRLLLGRYRVHRSNYKENSGRFRHAARSGRRRIYDSWLGSRDHRLFFPDRKRRGWRSDVKLEKLMEFLAYRPRRLRRNEKIRALVRETSLSPENLIYPIFVGPGKNKAQPVSSMPGVAQLSVDLAVKECEEVQALDIPAVILFGIPEHKDSAGTEAYADGGIVQQAIRAIKEKAPGLLLITDVCLCEYTDHGHCGVIKNGDVDNDSTLELLAKEALSHARAGADIVAPSDMMDGRVGVIRQSLDQNGFEQIAIMASRASGFYGPFREAAGIDRIRRRQRSTRWTLPMKPESARHP